MSGVIEGGDDDEGVDGRKRTRGGLCGGGDSNLGDGGAGVGSNAKMLANKDVRGTIGGQ
jgi:hypothetical protein